MLREWQESIIDPTQDQPKSSVGSMSPRPVTLQGAVLGLLDNGKANGALLLNELAATMAETYELAEVHRWTKDDAGITLPAAMLDEIQKRCDVVITAIGDCGSCSAATIADGILLERAGVPAVSICSDAFRFSADAMAEVYGVPGYVYATVSHPVARLTLDELRERVAACRTDVLAILGVKQ